MAPVFQGGDLCVAIEKGPQKIHCLCDSSNLVMRFLMQMFGEIVQLLTFVRILNGRSSVNVHLRKKMVMCHMFQSWLK